MSEELLDQNTNLALECASLNQMLAQSHNTEFTLRKHIFGLENKINELQITASKLQEEINVLKKPIDSLDKE